MDPVLVAKVAKMAAEQLKSEEKRTRLFNLVLAIVGAILLLSSAIVYMVTHPIEMGIEAFFGDTNSPQQVSNVIIKKCSSVEDTVWFYLKDIGFSDYGAAGAMGNAQAECSFDVSSCHNGIYHGLFQWGMGRWDGNPVCLKNFAEMKGMPWTDLQTQLSFFELECRVSYPGVYKQMVNATDVRYACDYFATKYEVCIGKGGDWAYSMVDGKPYQDLAKRRRYAEFYYKHYANKKFGKVD